MSQTSPPASDTVASSAPAASAATTKSKRRNGRRRRTATKVLPRRRRRPPGSPPGLRAEDLEKLPSTGKVNVTCIDYCKDHFEMRRVDDLDAFLADHRPDWCHVRWINVDGLGDMRVIEQLAIKYKLHPLAIEDLLNVHQRPKVDTYGGGDDTPTRLFIVGRMIRLDAARRVDSEQISFFLGRHTVLTFQERPGDVFDPVRARLKFPDSRLRQTDASFLLYTLLDTVVDNYFPVIEHYSDELEALDAAVLERADDHAIHDIHTIKHELMMLRREIWPMRELILALQRQEHENISDTTQVYLHDVYDHTVQIIDLVETYREVAMGLAEMWMSAMSNRMNEVMKVLTIIATIFIPITFLAGVYGMNFKYIPEYDWHWAYPAFWGICAVVAGGMLYWFRRHRWL